MSDVDAAFVKFRTKKEQVVQVDLDDQEGIRWIRNVCISGDRCYLLANKHESRVGLYLLQLDMNDPEERAKFLLNWNNKLDIGDCELAVMRNDGDQDQESDTIILSYKMIGYNTFNVVAIDLNNNCLIKYWHESYALWESPFLGFLLANNDFLAISKEGVQVLVLGTHTKKKVLADAEGSKRMIHSLGSVDYLKLEDRNHIMFSCQFYNDRQIWIQEQYTQESFTKFNDLFRIKIWEITLRELLLVQSIFVRKDVGSTFELVHDQPNPSIFLKVFLELGTRPLISYLAYDNQAIQCILHDDNKAYFPEKFPVFYCWNELDQNTNEIRKISTIDIALERN